MEKIDLREFVRDIPDFPKPGILFRDITPLLADGKALGACLTALEERARKLDPDVVVGIESRGFIFGVPLASRMGLGFVPVRKPGKLPAKTVAESYALEYGEDSIEIHEDALERGQRVLVVDDLLATGGTAAAAARLVRRLGAELVGLLFVIELGALGGREKLSGESAQALIRYD